MSILLVVLVMVDAVVFCLFEPVTGQRPAGYHYFGQIQGHHAEEAILRLRITRRFVFTETGSAE